MNLKNSTIESLKIGTNFTTNVVKYFIFLYKNKIFQNAMITIGI